MKDQYTIKRGAPCRAPVGTRRQKSSLLTAVLASTVVLFASSATAKTWHVYPKGNPTNDIAAIQGAIDHAKPGDTIVLGARNAAGRLTPFNLGNPTPTGNETRGTILVNKSLTITGEQYNSPMSDRTVIDGGFSTFYVDTFDPASGKVGGPVNFAMLESRQAVFSFIQYKACSGASITGINVYDPVPALPDAFAPSGYSTGINFNTTLPLPAYDPNKISGDILVCRCTVDCSNSAEGGGNTGISFYNHTANVAILDSQIINFTFDGIFNLPSAEEGVVSSGGAYDVHGCKIRTTRTFIIAGIFGFTVGITGGGIAGPLNISNNRVFIDTSGFGEDFQAIGIEANGDTGGGIIANNRVTIINTTDKAYATLGTFSFLVGSDNFQYFGNVLSGISEVAFDVAANNDTFAGNDLTGLTTLRWAVWCQSANSNVFERNAFGPQYDPKMPAIICDGNGNAFNHNDFSRTGLKGFKVSSRGISRAGCIFLKYGTSGNVVNASLSDLPQSSNPSYDPCTQIADGSFGVSPGNTLNLDFACNSEQYSHLTQNDP